MSFLLAEQNTNMALRYAGYGYILENGRVVMDGEAKALRENEDVKEFYLGVAEGERKTFRDVQALQAAQALAGVDCHPGAMSLGIRSSACAGASCGDGSRRRAPG